MIFKHDKDSEKITINFTKRIRISIFLMLPIAFFMVIYIFIILKEGNDIIHNFNIFYILLPTILIIFIIIYVAVLVALTKGTIIEGDELENSIPPEKIIFLMR